MTKKQKQLYLDAKALNLRLKNNVLDIMKEQGITNAQLAKEMGLPIDLVETLTSECFCTTTHLFMMLICLKTDFELITEL